MHRAFCARGRSYSLQSLGNEANARRGPKRRVPAQLNEERRLPGLLQMLGYV